MDMWHLDDICQLFATRRKLNQRVLPLGINSHFSSNLLLSNSPGRQLCHEPSGCLVLSTPLSSWWTPATWMWSEATFATWIEVPLSQIEMLLISKSKVQLPGDRRCLSVSWLLSLKARTLIPIQRQLPRYLLIPLLMIIQTDLQVRYKFWCALKIGTHKLYVFTRDAF